MTERRGDWIQTYTGKAFWPLDPRAAEIDLVDIAHALSNLCRFGGHALRFYSVAEHSVHVSRSVPPALALWGLLHDASEAYLVDLPRPIKQHVTGYDTAEATLMYVIAHRFGLDHRMPDAVKAVDNAILADEAAQVMAPPPRPWNAMPAPLGITLPCWSPTEARDAFLQRFREIGREQAHRGL